MPTVLLTSSPYPPMYPLILAATCELIILLSSARPRAATSQSCLRRRYFWW